MRPWVRGRERGTGGGSPGEQPAEPERRGGGAAESGTMSMLEVEQLTGGYGAVRVLHGLDFTVDEGEVVVILGANGAGKTTTLRALSGVIDARGRIGFEQHDIRGRRPEQIAAAGIAHVPQGRGTITDLTVDENLRLGAYTRRDRE